MNIQHLCHEVNKAYGIKIVWIVVLFFNYVMPLQAQSHDVRTAFIEGKGYLFIGELDSDYGYNVYRRTAGSGGQFIKRNNEPVRPANSPQELKSRMGNRYGWLVEMMRVTNDFLLYRRLRSSSQQQLLLSGLDRTTAQALGRLFIDDELEPAKQYEYKVAFLDYDNVEIKTTSAFLSAHEQKPLPPVQPSAQPEDNAVTLQWQGAAFEPDNTLYFNIYRSSVNNKNLLLVNDKPVLRNPDDSYTYRDPYLKNGQKYTYVIVAVDLFGRISKPSIKVTAVPVDLVPPAPPPMITAKEVTGGVQLVWPVHRESDVASYAVFRRSDAQDEMIQINVEPLSVIQPFYLDTTAVAGLRYYYSVTATDSSGNTSKKSNAHVFIYKDRLPPSMPADLTAVFEEGSVQLAWQASQTADLGGYHIYRSDRARGGVRVNDELYPFNRYSDSGYGDSGFVPGREYHYWVTAVDKSENESLRNHVSIKIPDHQPPEHPRYLRLENDRGHQVLVFWGHSPSHDVAFYELGRSGTDYKVLDTLAANQLRYIDNDVIKGQTYIYYVYAIDSVLNKSSQAIIDTVWVKDHQPPPVPQRVYAKAEGEGVRIVWQRVVDFDLDGYRVFRADIPTGLYREIAVVEADQTDFFDQSGDGQHWYIVRSEDTSANLSSKSKRVRAKP